MVIVHQAKFAITYLQDNINCVFMSVQNITQTHNAIELKGECMFK